MPRARHPPARRVTGASAQRAPGQVEPSPARTTLTGVLGWECRRGRKDFQRHRMASAPLVGIAALSRARAYGFVVMMDQELIKVSITFYPADVEALNRCVAGLRQAGLSVRGGTVVRALIHLTSATELFAHAVLLAKAYERKDGPRESDYVAGHPTVDLPPHLVKKLDGVVTELAKKLIPANRAFVVRALLRAAPDAPILAPAVQKYLTAFPARPRGWAARKARTCRTR